MPPESQHERQGSRPSVPDLDWEGSANLIDHGGTVSGSVPAGVGIASVVRIPVPGTNGLHIELRPRNYHGHSTSAIFVQDIQGKRLLRLDYGLNPATGRIDFHWNQRGTFQNFGISNHTPAGPGAPAAYHSARYFRYAGRVFLFIGILADAYSVVVARRRWRQVAAVVTGWAGAWAGCKVLGAGGALVGTAVTPGFGTAIAGIAGCMTGGIGGYVGSSYVAGELYDRIEEIYYGPVPEISAPQADPAHRAGVP